MKARQHIREYPCRGTRHWMEHVPPPPDWTKPNSDLWRGAWATMHLRCQRCGTYRHIAIDHMGYLLTDKYDHYPIGYKLTQDERPSNQQVRLWLAEDARRGRARHLKAVKGS